VPVGITTYGVYIPQYRIRVEEIARVWGDDPKDIKKGLRVLEKSVPDRDEDTATIAVEAARSALRRSCLDGADIGAIYVGSESHPYAVKPTATIVAEAIRATPELMAADFEFACKAGTAALQTCLGLVAADYIKYGMAIGADTAQGAPADALEYTAAAGGAAYVIGKNNIIAEIEDTYSFTTDTSDFWRREGQQYPKHGGRFTGEPGLTFGGVKASNIQSTAEDLQGNRAISSMFWQERADCWKRHNAHQMTSTMWSFISQMASSHARLPRHLVFHKIS